jgi:hypothetical protein
MGDEDHLQISFVGTFLEKRPVEMLSHISGRQDVRR